MSLVQTVYNMLWSHGGENGDITFDEVKDIIKNLSNTDYQDLTYAVSDKNYEMVVYILLGA